MAKINPQDLKDRLLAPGFTAPPVLEQLSDPISDTPMVLTLDQVLPGTTTPDPRNPKYDELKESIRHRGLDTPPPVTRRPGKTNTAFATAETLAWKFSTSSTKKPATNVTSASTACSGPGTSSAAKSSR